VAETSGRPQAAARAAALQQALQQLQHGWLLLYGTGLLMLLPSLLAWLRQSPINLGLGEPVDLLLAVPIVLHCLGLARGGLAACTGVPQLHVGGGTVAVHKRALYCAGLYMFAAALQGRAVAAHVMLCAAACLMLAGPGQCWPAAGRRRQRKSGGGSGVLAAAAAACPRHIRAAEGSCCSVGFTTESCCCAQG
jgi:hypothetical protein